MLKEMYWYCLAHAYWVSPKKWNRLRKKHPEVGEWFSFPVERLAAEASLTPQEREAYLQMRRRISEISEQYDRQLEAGIRFVSMEHPDYPRKLETLQEDAPIGLFVKGELPPGDRPSVAMIGARRCSNYGSEMARHFGKLLAQHGVSVISGMAMGADAKSQWGALEGGGRSYGVLGNGVDICYPKENFPLYMQLIQQGGILSEYPVGTPGKAFHFPLRNRIISGLSDCLIVIEAKEKSGTMITTDYALEQGKDVFAVPGRVGDVLSQGCNRLIQQGAGILVDDEDVLNYLGISQKVKKKSEEKTKMGLAKNLKLVYSGIDFQPKHVDEILENCGLPMQEVLYSLLQLELQGYIFQPVKNYYSKKG